MFHMWRQSSLHYTRYPKALFPKALFLKSIPVSVIRFPDIGEGMANLDQINQIQI